MEKKEKLYNFIIIIFFTFCVQFTDVKLGLIKFSELALLGLIPIILAKKIHKYVVYLLVFFSLATVITMLKTYFSSFQYLEPSFLKRPYLITVGRYLELITCLVLCNFVFLYFYNLKKKKQHLYYLLRFIDINIGITIIFAFIYCLVITNLLHIDDTRLVYNYDIRLRAYFVEGGPYGLMLSFIFILTSFFKKSKKRLAKRIFLFVVILFMAKSKSGFLCAILWLGIENYGVVLKRVKSFALPLLLIGGLGFYLLFINVGSMYVREIGKIKESISERTTDNNLVMGRISGFFIAPKMIADHPLFGIGIGNYPLLRNNDEYRGFFPLPKKEFRLKDAHGFGGIMDILVDTGFVGLFFFIGIMFHRYRTLSRKLRLFLIGFLILFCFGVQIYFLYPWMLFGLILSNISSTHEISGRLKAYQ